MRSKETPRTRVLVIGGWGRCGSTLLDMLLGEIEGFVSAGEVRELWLRGASRTGPAGAGAPFSRCSFWTQVGKEAFGGWDQLDLKRILRARYRWDRPWGLPALLASPTGVPGAARPPMARRPHGSDPRRRRRPVHRTLARLITAIGTVAGASVVVDSSKIPTHTLLLARSPTSTCGSSTWCVTAEGWRSPTSKHVVKRVHDRRGRPCCLGTARSARRSATTSTTPSTAPSPTASAAPGALLRYEDLVCDPRDPVG